MNDYFANSVFLLLLVLSRVSLIAKSAQRASDGLQVDYFISHHWAEDFGEFVQSVLSLGKYSKRWGSCSGRWR